MAYLRKTAWLWVLLSAFSLQPSALLAQPAVKSFITVNEMVRANPFQVADPTTGGGRTATVMVQETAAAYALTNTWSGTNTGTLIASSTPDWAWALLPLASGPNFYNSNGSITGPRTVDLATYPLLWRGPGSIISSNISSFLTYASSTIGLNAASDLSLTPGQRLLLQTPYITASGGPPMARNGDALTLLNAANGEADWRPIPKAITLYTGDGSLTTNRVVTLGGQSLTFKGPGPAAFNSVDSFSVTAGQFASLSSPGNVILESGTAGLLSLRTPGVMGGGAQPGQVLTLTGPNGVVEFATPLSSGGSNIYNTSGTITAHRTVNTTNLSLTFLGPGTFAVSNSVMDLRGASAQVLGQITTIGASNELRLQTPFVRNASAATGQVMTLVDASTGRVEYQTPTPLPTLNIYNSDGTLSGDRTVSGGGTRSLNFTNNVKLTASAATLLLKGSTALQLLTPGVANLTADLYQVPTLINTNNGQVEFLPVPNIYTKDGSLVTNRIVDGRGHDLSFTNLAHLDQRAWTNTVAGTQKFELITPGVNNGVAATNMVLTLLDRTTGRSDWQWPAVTSSVNIYNSDGSLTGQRNVDLGTNTLYWNGAQGTFFINGVGKTYVLGKTNWLYANSEWIGGIVGSTTGKVALATGKTVAGTAANGQVLTLIDAPGSVIEYQPPSNLYNNNGTLAGNRIVEANFRDFSLTNGNVVDIRGRTSVISGSLEFDLKTPKIASAQAVANQVLTLLDATTGRADYAALPAAPSPVNIYNTNGAIQGTRIINMNGQTVYWGSAGGLFQVDAINQTILSALTNTIAGTESTMSGSSHLRIAPPGGGNIGDVLTYKATGSDVWWQPPTHIYRSNGTLTGNRIVTGGGFDLSFTNNGTLALSAATSTIKGTSAINLVTPTIGAGAVANQVFTLMDATTGRGEWQNVNAPTGSVNIYNTSAALTGNRQVGLAGKDLIFDGAAGASRLISQNINYSLLSATDFILYSPWRITSSADTNILEAIDAMQLKTPKVRGGTAKPGDVLVLDSAGNVEFQTVITNQALDTSIYNTNGTLTGNRTLSGAGNNLSFLNLGALSSTAATIDLISGTRMGFKTPGVNNSSAVPGQFLQLTDLQTGAVEFATPNWQNLYTTDGSILGTRQVTITQPGNLIFNGAGTITSAATLQTVNFQATNVQLNAGSTLFLNARTNIAMFTPKMWLGQAQQGQVLTLTDSVNGYVDFAPAPGSAPVNIYNTSSNLTGNRVVGLNNQTLTFQGYGHMNATGLGNYDVDTQGRTKLQSAGAMEIGGTTSLRIKTPRVNSVNKPTTGQFLKAMDQDGLVEFSDLPPTSGANTMQFYADGVDSKITVGGSWEFVAQNITPGWPHGSSPPYGTRITVRVSCPGISGWSNAGNVGGYLWIGDFRQAIYPPGGGNLASGELSEGVVIDLVWSHNVGLTTFNGWVMTDTGWKSSTHGFAAAATSTLTNSLTTRVSTISFAAVVDVQEDLAAAPINLKKISTLGQLTVGDGHHADYYLSNYDPSVPIGQIVRSSVDLNKMWRKLIAQP
jgi:hypothetical protein